MKKQNEVWSYQKKVIVKQLTYTSEDRTSDHDPIKGNNRSPFA